MTKRFDRETTNGKTHKHHLQTLCAMNHLDFRQRGTHAYEQLFMTIARLGLDDEARIQTFRRMAFNVMTRNCDDHTKNFAFLLKQDATWQLTPAYDVTHAHNPEGEWTYQHLMSVNGKFQDISRADLLEVADRFAIRNPHDVLADIRAVIGAWTDFARDAGLSMPLREKIARDLLPV
jgi:serine/threonine-protein kinase HipA